MERLGPQDAFAGFNSPGRPPAGDLGQDSRHLWDTATGANSDFPGHRGNIESLAFRADGRTLASSARDSTAVVWDLSSPLPAKLDPAAWWADLIADDPVKAWAAVWHFADGPDDVSLPVLRERLKPATAEEIEKVRQAVVDLDNDRFAVRERAATTLAGLGQAAGPGLRAGLDEKPSAEARQRIEGLLEKIVGPPSAGESLRMSRALAALERKGTPEAKRLLKELAAGADGAWLTAEAQAGGRSGSATIVVSSSSSSPPHRHSFQISRYRVYL